MSDVLIRVDRVSKRLGDRLVLDDVSFEVVDRTRDNLVTGQVVGILGPSGVGKTTLMRIVAGLDAPDAGAVTSLTGSHLTDDAGLVFQHYPLLPHRTIRDNLEVVGRMNEMGRVDARRRADSLLDQFGLGECAALYPSQVSGGQRQRAAIAQQIVRPRRLLLLDEPFSGLDPKVLDDVMRVIVEVANLHDWNTVLLVTHDVRSALLVSDTLLLLGRSTVPGAGRTQSASIQGSYDLVARGLAWHPELAGSPAFAEVERELRDRFRSL